MDYKQHRKDHFLNKRSPKTSKLFGSIDLKDYRAINLKQTIGVDRLIAINPDDDFVVLIDWDVFNNFWCTFKLHDLYTENLFRFGFNEDQFTYLATTNVIYISQRGLTKFQLRDKYFGRPKGALQGDMNGTKAYNMLVSKTLVKHEEITNPAYGLIKDEIAAAVSGAQLGVLKNVKADQVWEYDLNSAYGYQLLDKIPDLESCRTTTHKREIDIDEIGWVDNKVIFNGFANTTFKLIDTPHELKKRVKRYYYLSKNTNLEKELRNNAKGVITMAVGMMAYYNPLLRHYVITKCNALMREIVIANADHIIKYNTDAIYSLKPLELDIGPNIGQFKVEILEDFVNKGQNFTSKYKTKWQGKQAPTADQIKEYFK